MNKSGLLMLAMACVGAIASCGDKLDPAVAEETGQDNTMGVSPSPSTNGNSTTGDGNSTATGNSNTPVSNGNTPVGNGNTPVTNPNNPNNPNNPTNSNNATGKPLCGTQATTISYATHISPLVGKYCTNCHGNGGTSPMMVSFASSKSAFTDRGAKGEIDSGSMPRGRTMSTMEICLFDTWATTNYAP